MQPSEPARGIVRGLVVGLVWVGVTYALVTYGFYLVPSFLKPMALETFETIAQTTATVIGLGVALALLGDPRAFLGLGRARALVVVASAFAAPLVFVLALWLGIKLAMPTLIEEFRRGGAAVSAQNLGEFGRVLKQAPAVVVLLWVAVVAPVSEELAFRGALWGAVERGLASLRRPAKEVDSDEELAPGVVGPSLLDTIAEHGPATMATVLQAVVFGLMHTGVPGGAGIIRLVSATVLGVCCGLARQLSGGLWAPIALHVAYNTLGLGHSRNWLVTEALPKVDGIPLAVIYAAPVCLVIGALLAWLERRSRK